MTTITLPPRVININLSVSFFKTKKKKPVRDKAVFLSCFTIILNTYPVPC